MASPGHGSWTGGAVMNANIIWKSFDGQTLDNAAHKCAVCSRPIFESYTFGKSEAALLYKCFRLMKTDEVEFKVQVADRDDEKVKRIIRRCVRTSWFEKPSQYANISRLRHWGLLYVDPLWWRNGIYQVTDAAISFARGESHIAKYLLRDMTTDKVEGVGCDPDSGEWIMTNYRDAVAEDWLEIGEYIKNSFPACPTGQLMLGI
jgi:hypothetical protein